MKTATLHKLTTALETRSFARDLARTVGTARRIDALLFAIARQRRARGERPIVATLTGGYHGSAVDALIALD